MNKYIELPREKIEFHGNTEKEKEANELIYDLTFENDSLQQEIQQLKEKLLQREIELNDCMNERNEFVGIIEEAIKILDKGLLELDERGRDKVYIEEYLENAIEILNKYKGDNNE